MSYYEFAGIFGSLSPAQISALGSFNGIVRTSVRSGDSLFVGGDFTAYTDKDGLRSEVGRVAKINLNTGLLDSTFDRSTLFPSSVNSLVLGTDDSVFVGGSFNGLNYPRQYIARLSNSTAKDLTGINSILGNFGAIASGSVAAFARHGNFLYVGGFFSGYSDASGVTHSDLNLIVKINLLTGLLDTTFDYVGFPLGSSTSQINAMVVSPDGNSLFIGGSFTGAFKGFTRNYIAKINTSDGSLDSAFGANQPNGVVNCLAISSDGSSLYVGGAFTTYGGGTRQRLARVSTTDGNIISAFDTVSGFDGIVTALALDTSGGLFVGGSFTTYKAVSRGRIAKINATTAALDTTFAPGTAFNDRVNSIVVDGSAIICGGAFTTYQTSIGRQRVAKLNASTAAIDTTFDAVSGFDGEVFSILSNGAGNLFVAGNFATYKSVARVDVAKINSNTAALDTTFTGTSFSSGTSCFALIFDQNNELLVGGNFTTYTNIPSAASHVRISKISATTAAVNTTFIAGVTTGFNDLVNVLLLDESGSLLVGGAFTSYNGSTRQRIAKISPTNAALDATFNSSTGANGEIISMVLGRPGSNRVFIGGSFTTYKSVSRGRIAKINTIDSSLDTTFATTTTTGAGSGGVIAMALRDGPNSPRYLYVGGSFTSFNSSTVNRFLVGVDENSGSLLTLPFSLDNDVRALLVDGDSLYASGSFTRASLTPNTGSSTVAGGLLRAGIMKLNLSPTSGAALRVDTDFNSYGGFNATSASTNRSLVLDGKGNIIASGLPTTYRGIARSNIARLNTNNANDTTGSSAILPANISGFGSFNGEVRSVLINGTDMYVGGNFTSYTDENGNVIPAQSILKFNILTIPLLGLTAGVVDPVFSFDTSFSSASNIRAMALSQDGTGIFIGGNFTSQSLRRENITIYNKTNGADILKQPNYLSIGFFNGEVRCSLRSGNSLFVGGDFTQYIDKNGFSSPVERIAKVDLNTGLLDATFVSSAAFNGAVIAMALDASNNLFVGGSFSRHANETTSSAQRLAKLNANTGAIDQTFIAGCNDAVNALVLDGSGNIFIGGAFTACGSSTRQRIAKLNTTTGAVDATFDTSSGFNNAVNANSLELDQSGNLIVGGPFTTYRLGPYPFIVKLNPTNANVVDEFEGTLPNSEITSMKRSSNSLFVGGSFSSLSGRRAGIARLNPTTAVDSTSLSGFVSPGKFTGAVRAVLRDGDFLYVGGDMTRHTSPTGVSTAIGRLAKVNLLTGMLDTSFEAHNYTFGSPVTNLAIDSGRLIASGDFLTTSLPKTRIIGMNRTNASEVQFGFGRFNGSILASLRSGNSLFVGGDFTQYIDKNGLVSNLERIAKIDLTTGLLDTAFSVTTGFNNTVRALAIDGTNGLYVGGNFTTYKGTTRNSLAKISAITGALDTTYNPTFGGFDPNVRVNALAWDSSGLYAGGSFTAYVGFTRRRIVKINSTTGAIDTTFVPPGTGFDSEVFTILLDGSGGLFVGGDFFDYGGTTRQYIAKISSTTAALDATFNTATGFNNRVRTIILGGSGTLYVGGDFTTYKSVNRQRVARIDASNSNLNTTFDSSSGFGSSVFSLILDSSGSLFAGGSFASYAGSTRNFIAELNGTTAALDANFITDSSNALNGNVNSLVFDSSENLILTGDFTTLSQARFRFAILSTANGTFDSVSSPANSGFNNTVSSLASFNNGFVFVGGSFTGYSLGNSVFGVVRNFARINVSTGRLDMSYSVSFNNSLLTGSVGAMKTRGSDLYVGGLFDLYCVPREGIIRFNNTNGSENTLSISGTALGRFDGQVLASVRSGNSLFVGGGFNTYTDKNGLTTSVQKIAKIDLTTGLLDTAFDTAIGITTAGETVNALALDGTGLYAGGNFTTYKGSSRVNILKINSTTAALDTTFAPTTGFTGGAVNSIAINATGLYAAGFFTAYNSTARNRLARINLSTAALDTTFLPGTGPSDGTGIVLAIDGTGLYVGGDFTSYNGTALQRLVKVDLNTAARITAFDTVSGFNFAVRTLAIDGTGLYVGGDFTLYKSVNRQRVAKVNLTSAALDTTFDSASGFDSQVSALVLDTGVLYVSGGFTTYKSTSRLNLAKINSSNASLDATFNSTTVFPAARPSNIILDGNGNLIGLGSFRFINSTTRTNLAEINGTTGALDTTFDTTTGFVATAINAIEIDSAGDLFVGGVMTSYKSNSIRNIAKINPTTAAFISAFNSNLDGPNGAVNTMLASSGALFVGGSFTGAGSGGSLTVNFIVKMSATSAAVDTAFGLGDLTVNPGFTSTVRAIILDRDNTSLLVVGDFNGYRSKTNTSLAKINATTPVFDSTFDTLSGFTGTGIRSIEMDDLGTSIFVGGNFTAYKGTNRERIAKINANTAALDTTFNTASGLSGPLNCITLDGSGNPIIGGLFNSSKLISRGNISRLSTANAAVSTSFVGSVESAINPRVNAMVIDTAGNLYVGGEFTDYNGLGAQSLTKINPTTGAMITAFNTMSGFPTSAVNTLAIDATGLYVGGNFNTYKSTTQQRIVKVNTIDASIISAFSSASGFDLQVTHMVLDGSGNIYVGGDFGTYKGVTRRRIAKINSTTAALDTTFLAGVVIGGSGTIGGLNNTVRALLIGLDGHLIVGGSFTSYNAISAQGLIKINTTTGARINSFNTEFGIAGGGPAVFAIAQDTNGKIFVFGDFTTYKGISRGRLLRLNGSNASDETVISS